MDVALVIGIAVGLFLYDLLKKIFNRLVLLIIGGMILIPIILALMVFCSFKTGFIFFEGVEISFIGSILLNFLIFFIKLIVMSIYLLIKKLK